jgi:hypothetical protein
MKKVRSLAAKAKCGALFENTTNTVLLHTTLKETGHPQPSTPVQVNNSTTNKFANKQIKQQRSKFMDMRFYWIQDRVSQKQFKVDWHLGPTNRADYFTKHHSLSHN